MKTITVQIGNSDDKLTQSEWCYFVQHVAQTIEMYAAKIHFTGGSSNWAIWQNFAWVFECKEDDIPALKEMLVTDRAKYRQDSLAYTEGETEFI